MCVWLGRPVIIALIIGLLLLNNPHLNSSQFTTFGVEFSGTLFVQPNPPHICVFNSFFLNVDCKASVCTSQDIPSLIPCVIKPVSPPVCSGAYRAGAGQPLLCWEPRLRHHSPVYPTGGSGLPVPVCDWLQRGWTQLLWYGRPTLYMGMCTHSVLLNSLCGYTVQCMCVAECFMVLCSTWLSLITPSHT